VIAGPPSRYGLTSIRSQTVPSAFTSTCRAKVDRYWCPEPRNNWTRVLRLGHPVLLPSPCKGIRRTPGKLFYCGTLRLASPLELCHLSCARNPAFA
jgi:hypothetical protein